MSLAQEFKAFVLRGNVVDLAVGVVIGTAFGKIVASMVGDIIMPPIGALLGGVDFTDLAINLPGSMKNDKGELIPVKLKYGNFLQTVFDFLVVASCLFAVVKGMNTIQKKEAAKPAEPTPTEKLLAEIRDELKNRK